MKNEPVKIKLDRILDLSNAVELVSTNETLDGKVAYWVGRLGDFCNNPVKSFTRERDKTSKSLSLKQEALLQELNTIDKEKEKEKFAEKSSQIQALNSEFTDKVKELLEQEETITVPNFSMSDFIAPQDISRIEKIEVENEKGEKTTKKVEIVIKKGQALVPIKFFKLMGEFIKE